MLDRIINLIDLESTGLGYSQGIVEVGIASFPVRMLLEDKMPAINSFLVNPEMDIQKKAFETHGISQEDVMFEPDIASLWERSLSGMFQDGFYVSGFNSDKYDRPLLKANLQRYGVPEVAIDSLLTNKESLDVMRIHRKLTGRRSGTLVNLCDEYGIEHSDQHRAGGDVFATISLLKCFVAQYGLEAVLGYQSIPEVPQNIQEISRLYRETKLEKDRLDELLKTYKSVIVQQMGDEKVLTNSILEASFTPGRNIFDKDKFAEDLGLSEEDLQPYMKQSESSVTIRLI